MAQERFEARQRLYEAVRDLFEEDDGSLPEIHVAGLTPAAAQRCLDALFDRADSLRPDQTVWDWQRDEDVPIADVPEVGPLAAEGKLSTLHVVLTGIRSGDVGVPDLGVSVRPGALVVDYRMGVEWTAEVVAGFVELLRALQQLVKEASSSWRTRGRRPSRPTPSAASEKLSPSTATDAGASPPRRGRVMRFLGLARAPVDGRGLRARRQARRDSPCSRKQQSQPLLVMDVGVRVGVKTQLLVDPVARHRDHEAVDVGRGGLATLAALGLAGLGDHVGLPP